MAAAAHSDYVFARYEYSYLLTTYLLHPCLPQISHFSLKDAGVRCYLSVLLLLLLLLLLQVYGFLMNDRRIYFIGERKEQIDTYSTKHSIQLRRLTLGGRCGQRFPVTSTDPFDIDECSRLIALVASERYNKSPGPVYQPLEGLLAVSAADGSAAVDIYMQVEDLIVVCQSGLTAVYEVRGSKSNLTVPS